MCRSVFVCLLCLTAAASERCQAAAPIDVTSAVKADVLKAEAVAKVEALQEMIGSEEAYGQADKKHISQASGTLACLAQALAEHKDGGQSGIAAPALRDAALKLRKPGAYADSQAALASIQAAMEGKGDGEKDFAWNKLINMHRMMEEFNARNSKIRRAVRRSRNPLEESGHATTMAVLGIAMLSDTHEVKNKAEIPQWESMSKDFTNNMTALAQALREGDSKMAQELYTRGAKSCGACHEKFRD